MGTEVDIINERILKIQLFLGFQYLWIARSEKEIYRQLKLREIIVAVYY